jgi:prepilin-type N-terminal cleavage/methylation domain
MSRRKQQNGTRAFTLVEIMIVVACIAALSVLAIPNLMRARMNANESVAQGTLKSIATACENFRLVQTPMAFPGDLQSLTTAIPAYMDDSVDTVNSGVPKNGYNFNYTQINAHQFVCSATPSAYTVTGRRTFVINETGLLRAGDNNAAVITTEAEYEAMLPAQ